jgi:hypothetical protein
MGIGVNSEEKEQPVASVFEAKEVRNWSRACVLTGERSCKIIH